MWRVFFSRLGCVLFLFGGKHGLEHTSQILQTKSALQQLYSHCLVCTIGLPDHLWMVRPSGQAGGWAFSDVVAAAWALSPWTPWELQKGLVTKLHPGENGCYMKLHRMRQDHTIIRLCDRAIIYDKKSFHFFQCYQGNASWNLSDIKWKY